MTAANAGDHLAGRCRDAEATLDRAAELVQWWHELDLGYSRAGQQIRDVSPYRHGRPESGIASAVGRRFTTHQTARVLHGDDADLTVAVLRTETRVAHVHLDLSRIRGVASRWAAPPAVLDGTRGRLPLAAQVTASGLGIAAYWLRKVATAAEDAGSRLDPRLAAPARDALAGVHRITTAWPTEVWHQRREEVEAIPAPAPPCTNCGERPCRSAGHGRHGAECSRCHSHRENHARPWPQRRPGARPYRAA